MWLLREEREGKKNMKKYLFFLGLILLATFSTLTSGAQTIELNTKQTLTISAPGFFPFSTISNDQLKKLFPTSSQVGLQFSNFLGSPCKVAPAADFSEIGPQITVNANGEFTVNFSNRGPTAQNFGLSLIPQGGTCFFDIFVTPPQTNTSTSSSSTSSSSSSSGGTETASNAELIQNAIDLETNAKNIDLNPKSPNILNGIQKIETSLSSLDELKNNVSTSMASIKMLIEKNITCATDKDNQVKAILNGSIKDKDILKAKKLLETALRCKKLILKKISKLE